MVGIRSGRRDGGGGDGGVRPVATTLSADCEAATTTWRSIYPGAGLLVRVGNLEGQGALGCLGGEGKEGDGPGVPYMILAAHPLPPTQNVSRILVCFWTCHPEGDAITQAWTNALGARVPGMAASRRGSLALPPCAQG